jgi:hypothetical protein
MTERAPITAADYFPRVEGNAFFNSEGRSTQLRLLEQLYFRIGLITLADLERTYGPAAHEPQKGP